MLQKIGSLPLVEGFELHAVTELTGVRLQMRGQQPKKGDRRGHQIALTIAGHIDHAVVIAECQCPVYGSRVVFCGVPSMGITMKVVNNLLSQSVQLMDLEAMALGMKAGLQPEVMLEVLTSTAADNAPLRTRLPESVLTGKYAPGFSAQLAHKDQGLGHSLAARLGVPLFTLGQARQIYSIALAQGLGQGPSEIVAQVVEKMADVKLRFASHRDV